VVAAKDCRSNAARFVSIFVIDDVVEPASFGTLRQRNLRVFAAATAAAGSGDLRHGGHVHGFESEPVLFSRKLFRESRQFRPLRRTVVKGNGGLAEVVGVGPNQL
jgi:hypothetical protein